MSFTELSEQEIIRRNSLNELAKLGIEAYPAPEFQVNAHAAEIKERFDETAEPRNVVIAGRMMSRRIMGKKGQDIPYANPCRLFPLASSSSLVKNKCEVDHQQGP